MIKTYTEIIHSCRTHEDLRQAYLNFCFCNKSELANEVITRVFYYKLIELNNN